MKLAELLTQQLPEKLNAVYFVNSGSEAVEGAMKLAKRYTGRFEFISCRNAYHGSTHGSASLMSDDFFNQAYRPLLPGIQHIDFNSESCLTKVTQNTAAVIVETIQGEAGVQVPTDNYLQKLRARCDETGSLWSSMKSKRALDAREVFLLLSNLASYLMYCYWPKEWAAACP